MLSCRSLRAAVASALLFALMFGTTAEALAQSSPPRPRVLENTSNEDDRDPVVFQRNVRNLADRAVVLGAELGLAPETLAQFEDIRQQLESFGTQEFAVAAEQLGPQIARANRALARIRIVEGPRAVEDRPAVPMSGGAWAYDPGDIVTARYPALDFNAQGNANSSGGPNTAAKVCNNHQDISCVDNDGCPQGDSCIDRPTNSEASEEISIFRGCQSRPSDTTIRDLAIVAVVFEGVMMVASRICDQEWFGFNVSLLCIITDLLFLLNRSFLDFEVMCADRWSGAENQSAYDRLGHLHGDLSTAQTSIDTLSTGVTNQFNTLHTNLTTQFTSLHTSLTSQFATLNTYLDNQFTSTNTNMNNQFTSTNTNVNNQFTTLTTLVNTHHTQIVQTLDSQQDQWLQAELERVLLHRERMAIYYLPEAQGGQLGKLRTLVQQTIDRVEASRETTSQARQFLGYAVTDISAGRFKRAFNYLSAAYFEAIKYVGEQQTP